ncbi:MAG: hypothetical protein VW779_04745 [Halieaceae bacterium]
MSNEKKSTFVETDGIGYIWRNLQKREDWMPDFRKEMLFEGRKVIVGVSIKTNAKGNEYAKVWIKDAVADENERHEKRKQYLQGQCPIDNPVEQPVSVSDKTEKTPASSKRRKIA